MIKDDHDPERRLFLLGAASAVTAASAASRPRPPASRTHAVRTSPLALELEPLINREREEILGVMERHNVEGVAVALVHRGCTAWAEGFGRTTTAGSIVGPDTIFSIQSTSKHLTATAILIAVQQGLLELDLPIARYLPRFSVKSRFEERPQDLITLRLLLSHRAGLTHEAPVGNNYDPRFNSFAEHVASISGTWLRYPVGTRYRYSNLGFDLAAHILERRTGTDFSTWVQRNLLDPLGMADSTFDPKRYAASANGAVGHQEGYTAVPLVTPLIASGGAYVSARDMATYASFHLGRGSIDGRRLLDRKLWDEMHGFALGGDYGLGVIRSDLRYGRTPVRVLSHKGGGFGFGSVFLYCPEAELGWAAMFNRPADACYALGRRLFDRLIEGRFGRRSPREPQGTAALVQLTALQKRALAGNFVSRGGAVRLALQRGKLVKHEEGQSRVLMFTSPEDAFVRDGDGEAIHYRIYPRRVGLPMHLECSTSENSLDQNDSPDEAPGPDRPEWSRYEGHYVVEQWGKPGLRVTVSRRNGYLYLDETRLVFEQDAGLFFAADGESVDFRGVHPIWKSLLLVRQS